MTCPPCNHNCEQGDTCPHRNNVDHWLYIEVIIAFAVSTIVLGVILIGSPLLSVIMYAIENWR